MKRHAKVIAYGKLGRELVSIGPLPEYSDEQVGWQEVPLNDLKIPAKEWEMHKAKGYMWL